jgi:alpha-beta hydrolase superfamily lysophospholipase
LVLVSPVVSGRLLKQRIPWPLKLYWRWRGRVKHKILGMGLPEWQFMESGWSYDLLKVAPRLVMPVLVVGAGSDLLIAPRSLRRLVSVVAHRRKRLEIVARAAHGFDRPWEMARLGAIVETWLADLPKLGGR